MAQLEVGRTRVAWLSLIPCSSLCSCLSMLGPVSARPRAFLRLRTGMRGVLSARGVDAMRRLRLTLPFPCFVLHLPFRRVLSFYIARRSGPVSPFRLFDSGDGAFAAFPRAMLALLRTGSPGPCPQPVA